MTSWRAADFDRLCSALLDPVLAAGRLELSYFALGVATERKRDKSPVTIADREAEAILLAALAGIAPDVPVIAEEAVSAGHIPAMAPRMFLVDALDGTHLFIKGKPEFSINVGMIENGRPVFGLIYGPHTGEFYVTRQPGDAVKAAVKADIPGQTFAGLNFETLATRQPDRDHLVALNSRAVGGIGDDFLTALDVRDRRPLGSSLKFCRIAAAEADLYARLGDTSEWDTAAGQAILEAAGGSVTDLDGKPLTYGHRDRQFRNPHFVAWARQPMQPGSGGD
jgi:3'(2'), 5'-bisphosphate nucleotidase